MEQLKKVDLNLLLALDALLCEHSVTRAARRLGMSTPALSHALARLREVLGDPLLVRAGRAMVPSPRAEELRPAVQAIVHDIRRVFEPTPSFDAATSNRQFRVRGSDYVLLLLGIALDQQIRAGAPSVRLQFMPNTTTDPDAVRSGELDLAVGVYRELHPEIRIQKLFDEDFVTVVRKKHPQVRKRLSLELYTKLQHIQIAPRGRPGGVVDDALAERGLARSVARMVPFFTAGLTLVGQTDYILTLPRRLAHCYAEQFGLRLLPLPVAVPPYAISHIWHPRHEADLGHRWLRKQLVAAAKTTKPSRR